MLSTSPISKSPSSNKDIKISAVADEQLDVGVRAGVPVSIFSEGEEGAFTGEEGASVGGEGRGVSGVVGFVGGVEGVALVGDDNGDDSGDDIDGDGNEEEKDNEEEGMGVIAVVGLEIVAGVVAGVGGFRHAEGEFRWSLKTVYLSPAIPNNCILKETSWSVSSAILDKMSFVEVEFSIFFLFSELICSHLALSNLLHSRVSSLLAMNNLYGTGFFSPKLPAAHAVFAACAALASAPIEPDDCESSALLFAPF